MIHHLTSTELDFEKYDRCISKAINTRIYASSWYLNSVCDDWDALVKDDYQAVMPLPKKKKFGFHYVYLPPWIQQLGIFYEDNLDALEIRTFISSIPKKFKLIDIFFNGHNTLDQKGVEKRQNFILRLNKPYELLKKQYTKGRRSNIKQAQKHDLNIIKGYRHTEIIELFKKNKGVKLKRDNSDYIRLDKLMTYALPLNLVESFGVINDKKELIGGAFFLRDNTRITYLFSAVNTEGRNKQAISFLLDMIIRINSESGFILDFEGSMISELASFFKSFGTELETYSHLKKYVL